MCIINQRDVILIDVVLHQLNGDMTQLATTWCVACEANGMCILVCINLLRLGVMHIIDG